MTDTVDVVISFSFFFGEAGNTFQMQQDIRCCVHRGQKEVHVCDKSSGGGDCTFVKVSAECW